MAHRGRRSAVVLLNTGHRRHLPNPSSPVAPTNEPPFAAGKLEIELGHGLPCLCPTGEEGRDFFENLNNHRVKYENIQTNDM
ncbi:Os06g0352100 [Oryza sativa Japonica Group]|uniref:Os06g0352100 protein n=1 Tax=Oryza sativa subsp. japonica TaxID=39947 RepID=C7J3F7_ORYSJ|nr:Os06g0352100 [Oryza sativa Japonica Group]|eukprot:NP_001174775.1 Os06g0352100 [Oryza sativa Japonica Group]